MYVHAAAHRQQHKVMVNFTLEQAMKAQRETRYVALRFLCFRCYIVVGGQCLGPDALPPEKKQCTICTAG
jgi:hypothetical protein